MAPAYRQTSDLAPRIPVFPLRGVILLPRAELPLNIFEPRYLAMLDDVIAGNRLLGILQPGELNAENESPEGKAIPLKRFGSVGRLTAFRELPDGRLLITLTGIARFTVNAEAATTKPYRLADVDYRPFVADLAEDASAEYVDRATVLRVLKSYLDARKLEADWNAINRAPLEPLINGLAMMSPFGPEEKQALLEAKDLKSRADVLMALAEMAIADNTSSSPGGTLQ